MAKPQAAAPADAPLDVLPEVFSPAPADALALAVAQGKEASTGYTTDLTEAKEVSEAGGTMIVRW